VSPTTRSGRISRSRLDSSVAFGVLLIVVGGVLLLDRAEMVDAGAFATDWWPLLIVGAGLWMALTASRLAGSLLVAIGLLVLAAAHDVVEADLLGLIWPAILVAIGAGGMVAGARMRGLTGTRTPALDGTWHGPPTATAVFGDARLNLADDGSDRAAVTAIAVFGDVMVAVPAGWRVVDRTTTLFGDVKIPRDQPTYPEAPVVEIHGVTLFGDTRVRYLDTAGSL
jgi:predicted membrane protein